MNGGSRSEVDYEMINEEPEWRNKMNVYRTV